MIADKKTWQRLLNCLGIALHQTENGIFYLTTADSFNRRIGIRNSNPDLAATIWADMQDLEKMICETATVFIAVDSNWEVIARNPYHSARSLEELEIRKDLVAIA